MSDNIPLDQWSGSKATKDLEKTIKSSEKKKFYLDLAMVIVVLISVVISIRSCQVSENAEDTAKEALDTIKYQFIQTNRPYIILSPKKFDDGLFWKVGRKGNMVEVALKYEVKNVGNIGAKDINIPDKLAIGPGTKLKEGAQVIYSKMGKVTLGPGDDFNMEAITSMEYESEEEAKRNLAHFISEKSKGVTFLISVDYTNELDESQKYRTLMMNRIHNEKALLIKSEMFNLSDIVTNASEQP